MFLNIFLFFVSVLYLLNSSLMLFAQINGVQIVIFFFFDIKPLKIKKKILNKSLRPRRIQFTRINSQKNTCNVIQIQ